jgi:hypothetical protein
MATTTLLAGRPPNSQAGLPTHRQASNSPPCLCKPAVIMGVTRHQGKRKTLQLLWIRQELIQDLIRCDFHV